MPGQELLKLLADLGSLGVLALFLIIGGYLAHQGLRLFRENILPVVTNHFEHMEISFDKMSESLDKHAAAIDSMKDVQEAQSQALTSHNELTRELIERLPKNKQVKRLLDDR